MNGLPPSTLRTTPHLLHTRTVLTLPPTTDGRVLPPPASTPEEAAEHEARRARERAEKRLQTLTKETDWRVAKAYVALAETLDGAQEDAGEHDNGAKGEEKVAHKVQVRDPYTGVESSLEAHAIGRYLDDDDWEDQERRAGRSVVIPKFPLFEAPRPKGKATARKSSWWKLR